MRPTPWLSRSITPGQNADQPGGLAHDLTRTFQAPQYEECATSLGSPPNCRLLRWSNSPSPIRPERTRPAYTPDPPTAPALLVQRPSRCCPVGGASAPGGAARRSTTGGRMRPTSCRHSRHRTGARRRPAVTVCPSVRLSRTHDRAFKGGRSFLRTRGAKRPTHRPDGPQLLLIRWLQECGNVCSFDGQEPRGLIGRGHAPDGARAGAESASFGAHEESLASAPGQSVGTPLSAPAV